MLTKYITVQHPFFKDSVFTFNKTHWGCVTNDIFEDCWKWEVLFDINTKLPINEKLREIYLTYIPIFDTEMAKLL